MNPTAAAALTQLHSPLQHLPLLQQLLLIQLVHWQQQRLCLVQQLLQLHPAAEAACQWR
jgi:hypothetical protein